MNSIQTTSKNDRRTIHFAVKSCDITTVSHLQLQMGLICCVSSSKWTITSCWYQETTFISNTGQSSRINVLWVLMRELTKGLYNLLYITLAWLVFRPDIVDLDRILNPKYGSMNKRHLQMNQFHPSNKEFEIGWYSYWRVLLAAGFSHPIRWIERGWRLFWADHTFCCLYCTTSALNVMR